MIIEGYLFTKRLQTLLTGEKYKEREKERFLYN